MPPVTSTVRRLSSSLVLLVLLVSDEREVTVSEESLLRDWRVMEDGEELEAKAEAKMTV